MSEAKDNTIGIRVDERLLNTLERLAKKEERTVSSMTRKLIIEALQARSEWKK